MGTHNDFNMLRPGSGKPVAGICHARGPNANLPPSGSSTTPCPAQTTASVVVARCVAGRAWTKEHGGKASASSRIPRGRWRP
jgi:hypothetical protein